MKKCTIIMNPQSGKKKKIKNYTEFYDILRKYGYDTEIILTKARGDAENIIQAIPDDVDLVISAGGDGTLNEIVSGNMKRLKKLLIAPLPMGSTNDVGNMYGLTENIYKNLEILLQGKPRKVDVCFINDHPFVYVACLGDYIDMAYNTPRELKEKYGKLAYILYGLRKIKTKINTYPVKFTVNNEEYSGDYSLIFISNSSRIAGQPDVYYDVKLNDNMFEVALAKAKTFRELSRLLVQVSSVDAKKIPDVTYFRTNEFKIEFKEKPDTSWCIDGEEYTSEDNTFTFRVEQSMKMLVPRENTQEIFDE